jgi:hypothetical protein
MKFFIFMKEEFFFSLTFYTTLLCFMPSRSLTIEFLKLTASKPKELPLTALLYILAFYSHAKLSRRGAVQWK